MFFVAPAIKIHTCGQYRPEKAVWTARSASDLLAGHEVQVDANGISASKDLPHFVASQICRLPEIPDHEQVHIALDVCLPFGVRPEEQHPVRVAAVHDEITDGLQCSLDCHEVVNPSTI